LLFHPFVDLLQNDLPENSFSGGSFMASPYGIHSLMNVLWMGCVQLTVFEDGQGVVVQFSILVGFDKTEFSPLCVCVCLCEVYVHGR
jgi:hypothetical protein